MYVHVHVQELMKPVHIMCELLMYNICSMCKLPAHGQNLKVLTVPAVILHFLSGSYSNLSIHLHVYVCE